MKTIINKFLLTLSVLLLTLSFSVSLQTIETNSKYTISGNVYSVINLDDEKMSDLYLEVLLVDLYLDNKLIDSTITNNGSYKISNLKTVNYQLKFTLTDKEAAKYGFVSNDLEAKTFKIDNIQLDSDQKHHVKVILKPQTSSRQPVKQNNNYLYIGFTALILTILVVYFFNLKRKTRTNTN